MLYFPIECSRRPQHTIQPLCFPPILYQHLAVSIFFILPQIPSRQTRLGRDPVSPRTRRRITEEREFALHEYRVIRPMHVAMKGLLRTSCCSIWQWEGMLQHSPLCFISGSTSCDPTPLLFRWETLSQSKIKRSGKTFSQVFSVTKRKMIWPDWDASPRSPLATLLTQHSQFYSLFMALALRSKAHFDPFTWIPAGES